MIEKIRIDKNIGYIIDFQIFIIKIYQWIIIRIAKSYEQVIFKYNKST